MGPARLRLLVLVVAAASSASVVRRRLVSRTDGDILLGALFPVHARGASPEVCGPLQVTDSLLFFFHSHRSSSLNVGLGSVHYSKLIG